MPKQLLLLKGKPIILYALETITTELPGTPIYLAAHPQLLEALPKLIEESEILRNAPEIKSTQGGATRLASVENGLKLISEDHDNPLVAIHDGVRPLVTGEIFSNAFDVAREHGSAVACVPLKDSIRMVEGAGSRAVDRSNFQIVQTPQVFWLKTISECYSNRTSDEFTDDASLAESFGHEIHLSAGSYDNIKITTPEDFAVAESILDRS